MSFTYSTLKDAIYAWTTEDSTTDLGTNIDAIINLAQRRVQRDLELDTFTVTQSGTLGAGNYEIARPADMIEAQEVYYLSGSSRVSLLQRSYSYLREYWPNPSSQDTPKYYAEDALTNIVIAPTPSAQITYYVRYLARLGALSVSLQNWLSLNHGDLLLFACLEEAEAFLQEEQRGRVSLWQGKYADQLPKAIAECATMQRVTGERTKTGGGKAPPGEIQDGD